MPLRTSEQIAVLQFATADETEKFVNGWLAAPENSQYKHSIDYLPAGERLTTIITYWVPGDPYAR